MQVSCIINPAVGVLSGFLSRDLHSMELILKCYFIINKIFMHSLLHRSGGGRS